MSLKLHALILLLPALVSHGHSGSHQPKDDFIRGCYMVNWAQYRPYNGSYFAKHYEPGICTHVFLAFAKISDRFEVITGEWNDIGSFYSVMKDFKRQDPQLKVLLSIGGWSFDKRQFREISSSPKLRSFFVGSLLRFLRTHGFDGFDLDWEYPESATDRLGMVALCKAIAERFWWDRKRGKKPELILTAAVAGGPDKIEAGYDVPSLARYLDFVNVMTYDFHGSWESKTGINSPLSVRHSPTRTSPALSTVDAVELWVHKGMPKEKVVVGLPTYGRGWTLLNASDFLIGSKAIRASNPLNYTREAGTIAFYETCELLKQGARHFRDRETGSAILVQGDQWFSYDDSDSFKRKLLWVKEERYGGAFVWSLDTDDFKGIFCSQHKGETYPLTRLMSTILKREEEKKEPHFHSSEVPLEKCSRCSSVTFSSSASSTRKSFKEAVSDPPSAKNLSKEAFRCPDDGLFANPDDEQSFYNCSGGTSFKVHCENGTLFSGTNRECSQPPKPTSRPSASTPPTKSSAEASPNCSNCSYSRRSDSSSLSTQSGSSTSTSLHLAMNKRVSIAPESFTIEKKKPSNEGAPKPSQFGNMSQVGVSTTMSRNSRKVGNEE